jgi:SAM-dependent methyltransferase
MVNGNDNPKVQQDRTTETTPAGISWVQYAHCRKQFKRRWPCVWSLGTVMSPFDIVLSNGIKPGSILDIGATERVWESKIKALWPNVCYRSLDIDRTNKHDYYSFEDIDMKFDLIICFEVLEHIRPSELVNIIQQCISACKPGQYLLFSVPNLLSDSYWMDFTHQTALSFWDLPTLMSYCGLEVIDGARWFMGSMRKKVIHQYLFYVLHRILNKDFCQSVLMMGRKSTG